MIRKTALSVPITKTSIVPAAREVGAGREVHWPPPIDCQPVHEPPAKESLEIVLSAARANTSSRPEPHDDTLGAEPRIPPRASQPLHAEPFHHLWYSPLSHPRTKTSRRLAPHEVTAGPEVA